MDLYVGQKLKVAIFGSEEIVEIIEMYGQNVKLLFNGKTLIMSINRVKEIIIGYVRIVTKPKKRYEREYVSSYEGEDSTNITNVSCKNCKNCMEMKKGDCIGGHTICSSYRPCPKISREEMKKWPTQGDASTYRERSYFLNRNLTSA